jgi:ribosomal protein S3
MNQNDVKKGDQIVKVLIGGGFETASIATIEKVTKGEIYLEGCDGDYNRESVYAYDLATGRACSNYIPGFTARLIILEQ